MMDYEWMILDMVDDDGGVEDDCANCPYKGDKTCRSQCEKEVEIYNPYIQKTSVNREV